MSVKYEIVSGLEIHVELLTKTKLFCACPNAFGANPNSNTCPVCAGLPGSLPVLNKEAVRMAMMLGIAVNCDIAPVMHFDRKNYFYPDNPQNYQITQLNTPICTNGFLEVEGKKIRIKEMHLEDDAGKLIHEDGVTLIDYNRSGVPLIEIVTEPDFGNADEVISFLKSLMEILRELEICDCKMQEGSLRVDVNLSVRPVGETAFGVRSEIKNINSFTEIRHVFEYEKNRHIHILTSGEKKVQDTRGWDEKAGKSFFMREKENVRDYRYFPEPDLPLVQISKEDVEDLRKNRPMLPAEKKKYIQNKYKTGEKETEFLCRDKACLRLFEELVGINGSPVLSLNWLSGEVLRIMNLRQLQWKSLKLNVKSLAHIMAMVEKKEITMQTGKALLEKLFDEDFDVADYVTENNLKTNSDEGALKEAVIKVLAENEKSVCDYLKGKDKALQYLIGQGMRLLKGRADVSMLSSLLKAELEKKRDNEE